LSKSALIAEEKRKEREMLQQLEKQEENTMGINQQFSSLQQEVDFKTKKLKKYFAKFQSLKDEISDVTEANSKERQLLEDNQTELQRDLKLKLLIIENFIPLEEREKLTNRVFFDPEISDWKSKTITKEKFVIHFINLLVS